MSWSHQWAPYVPVARRRANASSFAAKLAKKEKRSLAPVTIEGRKIVQTFWGQSWCDNLEAYGDFANRLPRGRTYVRNGSVVDLQIERGEVKAYVSGSQVYRVEVSIGVLKPADWKRICEDCSQSIESVIDLLRGRFDKSVMERLTRQNGGLFPKPKEISLKCSCPDYAVLCKHVAAVLYGVGARLDTAPEMLFALRGVNHLELASQAIAKGNLDRALDAGSSDELAADDLGAMFGIELDEAPPASAAPSAKKKAAAARQGAGKRAPAQVAKTIAKGAAPTKKKTVKKAKRQTAKAQTAKAQPAKAQPAKALSARNPK